MKNLIDTHFHLDHYKNYMDIAKCIADLQQYTICVTNSPGVFLSCKNLIIENKFLKFAIGFHPQDSSLTKSDLRDFIRLVRRTNYIGEIGLDYTRKIFMEKSLQVRSFEEIIECGASENKLMSIHLRHSEEDAIRILEKYHPARAIIHWYTGNADNLRRLVEVGCFFSINSNMVSGKKSNMYHYIPSDRLLIESDGPYTKVNRQKFEPALLKEVYGEVARFYDKPNLISQVYDNFKMVLTI